MADVLAAVDVSTLLAGLTPVLVIAISVALAMKATGKGKQAIGKV